MSHRSTPTSIKLPPIVRARILLPLMTAFKTSGGVPDRILAPHGLSFAELDDPAVLVPHETVYRLFEAVAEATSPDFPALVGQSASLPTLLPFGGARVPSRTLADFIATFCILAMQETNAVTMSLDMTGNAALFSAKRSFVPETSPAQMDAYQASLWVTFLHEVAGDTWAGERVLLRVNRPRLLPSYLYGIRAVGSDNRGYSIRFPSDWLLCHLPERAPPPDPGARPLRSPHPLPTDLLALVNGIAASQVARKDFSVASLSAACGFREAALNRRLATYGTSLSRIIAHTKCRRAKDLLGSPGLSVGDVALRLGYSDATALTRAFKNWTGQTPTDFRAHLSQPGKAQLPQLRPVSCTCNGETLN